MTTDDTSGLARGQVDGLPIYVGDQVMIKAEVLTSVAGVGAMVRLFSKTDEMKIWIAEEHLQFAAAGLGEEPEPEDGTWLLVQDRDGNPRVFHRSDADGHNDRGTRRYDRHWWDVINKRYIDWPSACAQGAAGPHVRRVYLAEPS